MTEVTILLATLGALVAIGLLVIRGRAQRRTTAPGVRGEEDITPAWGTDSPYQFLVERIPEAFVVARDGKLVFVNRAFRRIFGVSAHEALGRSIDEFVEPASGRQLLAASADSDPAVTWSSQWVEVKARHASGRERWLEMRMQLATWGGEVAQIGLIADVSARHQAENALKESEQRFHSFFANAPVGLYRTTPDGRVLLANPALVRMLGYESVEELASINLEHEGYYRDFSRQVFREKVEREGESRGFEAIWRRADGTPIVVVENAKAIRNGSGELLYYDGSVEDVTERKALEDRLHLLERVEAIGQLAGGIAHDFNNLLLAVLGSTEILLRRRRYEDSERTELDTIYRTASRAAELTRRLLAFSRRQVLEPRDFSLNDMVADFLPVLERVIPEHVSIEFAPASELWTAHADPGQIEQVLMNLCINARDAMPNGGALRLSTDNVTVGSDFLETHPWGPPGEYSRLAVEDTGTGMDRETLSKLFQPFFTTKQPGKGTGLGLATVYGIVKQHGGMVDVRSELGRGTTFHVYLPRVNRPAQALARRDRAPAAGGSERILVVDDDPEVRRILNSILLGLGYAVELASNGEDAMAILRRPGSAVDLVITDVVMPRMGGVELAEKARQESPTTRFLFSSGYSEQAIEPSLALRPGFGYLAKPYSIDDLAHKLRDLLDGEPIPTPNLADSR